MPRTAGFALKKNEPGFLDFVNQTLLKLEASGEAAKIYDAWFAPVPRTFHIQPMTTRQWQPQPPAPE